MNEIPSKPPTQAAPGTKPEVKAPRPSSEATGIPSFETMDRLERAVAARLTQGVSPHALYAAWFDWASHLANAPGRLIELGLEAVNLGARYAQFATRSLSEDTKPPFEPQPNDRRFSDEAWKHLPYVLWQQAFLAEEAWWQAATREVRGMTPKNAARVAFITRQLLDVWSPSNVPWLNPVIIERTIAESGANLVRGAANLQSDAWRALAMQPEPPADGLRGGRGHRRHAGRGRLPQRADGAHPVQADHRQRHRRAGADRAGLDHEILRPRSEPAQLARALSGRARLHRVHGVVAQPHRR